MSISIEEVLPNLKNLEKENQALCEIIFHLQTNQISTSLGCVYVTQPQSKEPQITLPNKFDNAHSKFRGFVNQMHLVI
jgi:hypothetical protein